MRTTYTRTMNIGKSLRLLQAENNVNNIAIAAYMGTTRHYVSNLRNNKTASAQTMQLLASFFDISVSEFIARGE